MADTEAQAPENVKTEGGQPRQEYAVIPSQREMPETGFVAQHAPPAGADGQNIPPGASNSQPNLAETPIQHVQKLAAGKTRVYAAAGIGLGLLAGLLIAVFLVHPGGQNGSNDMGTVASSTLGLKGHLILKWGDKLGYHLTVEPGDPAMHAAFVSAVGDSPRPLSLTLQLKDPFGAVLCGNSILLKFDPRKADLGVVSDPGLNNSKKAETHVISNRIAQSLNLARLENQEIVREHGKDVFQEDIGPDGKLASLLAQGTLPCTKKQYDSAASWSFITNFPAIAPPAGAANSSRATIPGGTEAASPVSTGKSQDVSNSAAEKKPKKEPAPPAPRIYIEGDDAIVWYDAPVGIVETSAGKALLLDKSDAFVNALKGREFPIDIHYKCDQSGACTFAGSGLGVQHARLRR